MQTPLSSHSLLDSRQISQIQQRKMKTILCAIVLAALCLMTFSLSTAIPIDSSSIDSSDNDTTALPLPVVGYVNGSKLVVTNVIKTLEFEVALQEDDDSTDASFPSTPFIETEIKILNPALLEAIVAVQKSEVKTTESPESSETSESSESLESDESN